MQVCIFIVFQFKLGFSFHTVEILVVFRVLESVFCITMYAVWRWILEILRAIWPMDEIRSMHAFDAAVRKWFYHLDTRLVDGECVF